MLGLVLGLVLGLGSGSGSGFRVTSKVSLGLGSRVRLNVMIITFHAFWAYFVALATLVAVRLDHKGCS